MVSARAYIWASGRRLAFSLMPTATALPAPRLIDLDGLDALYQALVADGYHVIGQAVQDGAIVLRDLSSAAELPMVRL